MNKKSFILSSAGLKNHPSQTKEKETVSIVIFNDTQKISSFVGVMITVRLAKTRQAKTSMVVQSFALLRICCWIRLRFCLTRPTATLFLSLVLAL